MAEVLVGVAATTAPWSAALRSYIRDHTQEMSVEVIMDRAGLTRSAPKLDVLVIDDIMRSFSAPDVAHAQACGVHVLAVYDHNAGMGREYLLNLGADEVLSASTAPAELISIIAARGPRLRPRPGPVQGPGRPDGERPSSPQRRRALISAWTKVSGGSGLTEAVVTAAEHISKRARVLLIEADEIGPVLASRLLRSAETSLAWAVSRAGQGYTVLPQGLSGPRGDGTTAVGHFDVICGTPGAAQVIAAPQLLRLVDEAAATYDHVMVETSWLVGTPSGRERFSAARALLATADRAVVLASADPEGAARLVEWRAASLAAGCTAICWAAFGRARGSRYERSHLASLVEANTGRYPFEGLAFLPEDPTVARARWNAEIVWRGPWLKAVRALADVVTVASAHFATAQSGVPQSSAHVARTGSRAAEVATI